MYLLKSKDETFENFMLWKNKVEGETEFRFKCLRTDNGLKIHNYEFDNFCKNNCIRRNLTVSITSRQDDITKKIIKLFLKKKGAYLLVQG